MCDITYTALAQIQYTHSIRFALVSRQTGLPYKKEDNKVKDFQIEFISITYFKHLSIATIVCYYQNHIFLSPYLIYKKMGERKRKIEVRIVKNKHT